MVFALNNLINVFVIRHFFALGGVQTIHIFDEMKLKPRNYSFISYAGGYTSCW